MPAIDFLISNPGHHVEAARPLIERLTGGGCRCRVLSLCEFRGFRTPRSALDDSGAEVVAVLPWPPRRPASFAGGGRDGGRQRLLDGLRAASWRLLLAPALARAQRPAPDLVVTPNDAAFPYDRIMARYRRQGVATLLLQEGIRFPLPAEPGPDRYGTAAAAIAAWGQTSADHFRDSGVAAERLHLTGSPRLDQLDRRQWARRGARLRRELGLGDEILLLASNPIDDQGFCTADQKLALVERFVAALEPLFTRQELHLVIKLHGREDPAAFAGLAGGVAPVGRVTIARDEPLYALLAISRAVIVLASTVGLEALLFDRPLGVLEIPGRGFAHDYVEAAAALGLEWSRPLAPQVEALLDGAGPLPAASDYIQRTLAHRGDAADEVCRLIRGLAG